jgi:glycosyltransferase involved in cell wall biosynthesis
MRILVAHCSYRLAGGEDRYVREQLELLRPHHEVMLFERHSQELASGLGTAARMGWSRSAMLEMERQIGRARPQVVHLHNAYPGFGPTVHLAAEKLSVPLVMTVHNQRLRCPNGLMFTQGETCRRCESGNYLNAAVRRCFPTKSQSVAYATSLWLHRFVLRLEGYVNLFIAPSEFMAGRLASWGISRERMAVVRNFAWSSPMASPEVGSFGLYVGRLSPEKGIEDLLRALRTAGDPPFRIVGSGPLEARVSHLVAELGLTRTVVVGRRPHAEIRQMLRRARFLAVPSRCEENAPLAAIEALSEARPLLVTRAGGLPELAEEGRGLICNPGDINDMAESIRRMMDDDDTCYSSGDSALAYYRRSLSPTAHRCALEAAYRLQTQRPLQLDRG